MLNDLLRILFPSNCINCKKTLYKGENFICSTCCLHIPYRDINENLNKKLKIEGINHLNSFLDFNKKGITQGILHEIKYKDNIKLAHYFGSAMAEMTTNNYEYIIPVPLHPKKKRKRGYNQAKEIAFGLSLATNIPINQTSLKKVKHTSTQTKKNKMEREANVLDTFSCSTIKANKIMLLDDVVTTGSTLNECVKTIKKANPNIQIDIFCLAYASL